ncbi:C40 family peptidase [Sanguibacter antarcticus]|uniref:Cell wall-associated NlpC family hydrolase n=1 Tax=Sanguibacter antarcticus TaxID=372484 RepID=A0A2A9E136_9MICO|nr:C40 family peptidase [Sanguibacter antarcticus]PFG32291.1 cell wall-associated NlpC family hydrolase [Sanguibacter antarcticus]
MTTSTTRARHRQARRPISPLTTLVSSATGNAAVMGRRTAVVAASSGLLVSFMGAGAAMAAPASSSPALNSVDVSALTTQARAALNTAPAVTVAADATWTVEQTAVSVTPKPEAAPEVERTVAATRSAERTSLTEDTTTTASATTETAAAYAVPASAAGSSIIDIASRYVGVPYVLGGSTPDGFDCSGFTAYVFAQAGISLPRTAAAQHYAGTIISRDQAQAGDLIWSPGHITIYAGGNTQIDAPKPGGSIQFRSIWQSDPVFIRIG